MSIFVPISVRYWVSSVSREFMGHVPKNPWGSRKFREGWQQMSTLSNYFGNKFLLWSFSAFRNSARTEFAQCSCQPSHGHKPESVCLFVCLFIIYLLFIIINLFICLFVRLFVCLFIYFLLFFIYYLFIYLLVLIDLLIDLLISFFFIYLFIHGGGGLTPLTLLGPAMTMMTLLHHLLDRVQWPYWNVTIGSGLRRTRPLWVHPPRPLEVMVTNHCLLNRQGGHINPAVTLAFAMIGKLPFWKVPVYFLAQYLGAFMAAAVVFGVYHGMYLLSELYIVNLPINHIMM